MRKIMYIALEVCLFYTFCYIILSSDIFLIVFFGMSDISGWISAILKELSSNKQSLQKPKDLLMLSDECIDA